MPGNYNIAELKRLDVAHHLPSRARAQGSRSFEGFTAPSAPQKRGWLLSDTGQKKKS